MNSIARAYLEMRAAPPAPKLGARVGFLTESASEQFLAEYNRMREANLIVPSAINTAAASGQMMLTEAVEYQDQVDEDQDHVFDALTMSAAKFLHEYYDEVSDSTFRLIAALPGVFAGLAREWDVPLDELTEMLLDPAEDQRVIADATLNDIIENLEEQLADDDDVSHEMALDSQDRSLKKSVIDVLRSGYTPGSEGDRMFAALHRVERWEDPSGNGDEVFKGSNIRHATPLLDRSIPRPAVMSESHTPWGIKPLSGLRQRT
jgi:hypothetical protein